MTTHQQSFVYISLQRFLKSRVGELWSDVLSEISERYLILDYVGSLVTVNIFVVDGIAYCYSKFASSLPVRGFCVVDGVLVHQD